MHLGPFPSICHVPDRTSPAGRSKTVTPAREGTLTGKAPDVPDPLQPTGKQAHGQRRSGSRPPWAAVIILVLLAVMAAPSSPPWLTVWNAGPVLNRPDRERLGSAERRLATVPTEISGASHLVARAALIMAARISRSK